MATYGGNYGNYGNNNYGNNDYSTTSYGGQGGAGGGGFMGGSQPQGSQGGASKYAKESLRPCTILQVTSAPDPSPDADIRIDDSEAAHVHIIGQIRTMSKQATNTTYVLDDGTGTIDVKVWTDTEKALEDDAGNPLPQSENERALQIGKWARCFGKVKQFNNKRHVGANMLRPIRDTNAISYHLLEATAVHLFFTRGPPGGGDGMKVDEEGGLFVPQDQGAGGPNLLGFSAAAKAIVEFLKNAPENNEGYNAQHIAAALKMQYAEILKAGDELMSGSVIYGTTDDHTWSLLE